MGDKHTIVGGILLSASIFLGGLAITVFSSKEEEACYDLKGD